MSDEAAQNEDPGKAIALKVLYGVFFLSGMSALLYQLAWQRLLFLTYGTNSEAITAIVAAFMLGLGVGSLIGGVVSEKYPEKLIPIFAGIELAIGLFGAISVPLIIGVGQATAGISALAAGAIAFGVVCIPTMLMGATLPVLVTHIVGEDHEVGEAVGDLYHFNTLGSASVCILAAMFIFRFGGLYGAVGLGVVFNFIVAGVTYLKFRGRK